MKRKIEINIAWTVWNLLENLNVKVWKHYEKDILEIILKKNDDLIFFKKRSEELIPF